MTTGPVQIAYAVDDVRAAVDDWAERGVGPFFVLEHIGVSNVRVRGEPGRFDHSSAYGWWGVTMVELLCEHHLDDERIGPRRGVHHLAFFVDDVAEASARFVERGLREVLYAETGGGTPFAMFDPGDELGHLLEIYVPTPRLTGFYHMVRRAAEGWDGSDPFRPLT